MLNRKIFFKYAGHRKAVYGLCFVIDAEGCSPLVGGGAVTL